MDNYNNTFSFDIGIGSIGSVVAKDNDLVYMGVRTFESASEAKEARLPRSARRNLKRKGWRKKQLLEAFNDFAVLSIQETSKPGYLCYTAKNEFVNPPKESTVYHLRAKGLREKIEKREILLCLYNILQARGHFILETIDFTKDKLSLKDYQDKFYSLVDQYVSLSEKNKTYISSKILSILFSGTVKQKDLISLINKMDETIDDESLDSISEILKLLAGFKASPKKINEELKYKADKTINVDDIKKEENEEVDSFLIEIANLYDMAKVSQILSDHDYLCDVCVEELDDYQRIIHQNGINSDEFKEKKAEIEKKQNPKHKHIRVIKNIQNNYPNGLYVKECIDLLKKQSEFYPEITNDFIEVCSSIVSARIPYFIGPLGNNAKNGWVTKNGKVKYSYDYTIKHNLQAINVTESIEKWKERMISRCTYFPDEYALPKGSLLAETYSILNEMNILKAVDSDGNDYYLTSDDKIKVIDELFLSGRSVRFSDVEELLKLESFGTRKSKNTILQFNNKFTLYPQIAKAVPELKLDSIKEIYSNFPKIEKIEDIILHINLYNEEKTKIDYFVNTCKYDLSTAKKLAQLKSNSFYSFSRYYLLGQVMNKDGFHMLDILFEDNSSSFTNEQMTILNNATDIDGNKLDFMSSKYVRKIKENDGKLDISLLMDESKPVIPVSRPVIRALNECLKVYTEMVKAYGVPARVIIETARDLKDHTEIKERPAKHFKQMKNMYDHIQSELKEKKKYQNYSELADWEELKGYVESNKAKINLYITQNGVDLLTGEAIDINNLQNYEIDHIVPRGFGDDSIDDKMLILREVNAKKSNRLPLQFLESGDQVSGHNLLISSEYIKRVEALFDMKLISEEKKKKLLLETEKDLESFINQNLSDTRYIIREFMSILKAYNSVNGYPTHIVALKSAYTNLYRKAFRMDKDRGYGDQHHCHDAALLYIADKSLSEYYPHYDERKYQRNDGYQVSAFNSYNDFVKQMINKNNDQNASDDLNRFIIHAYEKAFKESAVSPKSFINKVKNTVPFYSTKVEKNYKGKFFEATIHLQKEFDEKAVLSILGVNDSKKVFSGVECVAVDFYKYKDKKGNKKHLAVHIPKVIVDSNGNINKDKYIKLVKEHYKANEILDEDGNIKEYFFRFRVFRNDLIYETQSNVLTKFNIGSIVNQKLELKFVNVFSYNQIYDLGKTIAFDLNDRFNIKNKKNPGGIEYKSFDNEFKKSMINYVMEKYYSIDKSDKHIPTVYKKCEAEKNVHELANHLSYLGLLLSRPGTPPSIDGQYLPVINSELVKINPDGDTEYIKIKNNILGIRCSKSINNKMIIECPKNLIGQFSKIRKEPFSWQIA